MLHFLCISLQNYEILRLVSFWYEPGCRSHLHISLFVLLMCLPCVKEAGFWFSFQNIGKAHVFQDASCVLLEMWSGLEWQDYPRDSLFQLSLVWSQKDLPSWVSSLRVASPVGFHRQRGCSLVSSVSGHPAHPQGWVSWVAISTDTVLGSMWAGAPGSWDSRGRGGCWLVGTWSFSELDTRKGEAGSFINRPRRKTVCPCDRKKVD